MNPVRAGMAKDPAEHAWSSYLVNAHGKQDRLIDPHELYLRLANNVHDRQSAYRALFSQHIDNRILNEIRQATNTEWVLGNDRFRERIGALTGKQVQPKPGGGDRKSIKFNNHY